MVSARQWAKPKNLCLMKTRLLVAASIVCFSFTARAQEVDPNSGLSFGMQLNQYQRDFGLGFQVTSPAIFNDHLALRARYNFMFHEYVNGDAYTWEPYSNLTVGVIGYAATNGSTRLYGEGGLIMIFPSSSFASGNNVGGYGLFGFEFFMANPASYFIELGGVGSGARADKLPLEPIYSNGFMISTGFRFTLP